MDGAVGWSAAHLVNAGLVLLAVVGAARGAPGSVVRALALATGAAALAFGPLMVVATYATTDTYFEIPARYGISLVAPMAVLAGTAVRSRRGSLVLVATGVVLYIAVVVQLLL
jgi:hypothetical protein